VIVAVAAYAMTVPFLAQWYGVAGIALSKTVVYLASSLYVFSRLAYLLRARVQEGKDSSCPSFCSPTSPL
jgi:hypothetical protein